MLTPLRTILRSVAMTLPLLGVVLWFVLDGEVTAATDDPVPWILLAVGTATMVVGVRYAKALPLQATSSQQLGNAFQTGTFIGIAAAELPALLGFVGAFLVGAMWPYLVGIVPALIGLRLLAPTQQRLSDIDRSLRSRGRDFSTSDAFDPPPPTHGAS